MKHSFLLTLAPALLLAAPRALAQSAEPPPGVPTASPGSSPSPPPSPPGKPTAPQDDEDQAPAPQINRNEPTAVPPPDPLAIPPDVRERIGSDWDGRPSSPEGGITNRRFFPYYEERRGDYRLRMIPPLWLEHTRGLPDPTQALQGIPKQPDRQSLFGLLYYQRRSLKIDADVLFPFFWHLRDEQTYTTIAGPFVHREAPGEHDNWLAPLAFTGSRRDGGYFHLPFLLTTSHWGEKGAFTLAGLYFRDRTGTDVDAGVVPFYFHGDNGNTDGNRRTYTLIPPLLYYHHEHELDDSSSTVAGPVIIQSTAKRNIFDVAPLFFHIEGKPESGGIRESHTTLFPFFHYGHTEDKSLFVIPGYYRRVTKDTDTMITPFYSHAETRNGSTRLDTVGPVIPLYFRYRDLDIGQTTWGLAPLFYTSSSPKGQDFLTPLFGRFESYGVSRTYWAFPTFVVSTDTNGWEADLHPILYFGRDGDSTHNVVAPVFWDFNSPRRHDTVAFPLYWHFENKTEGSLSQLAVNTFYSRKRVAGGNDWQFHFFPLFSFGANPEGHWWNVLYGLTGYERSGSYARVKAFWVPIQVDGPKESGPAKKTAFGR